MIILGEVAVQRRLGGPMVWECEIVKGGGGSIFLNT
jgi:hypothetical protein